MPKITVNTKPVASHYQTPDEKIIEFTAGNKGGLISIRTDSDGSVSVQLYRMDDITVTVSYDNGRAKITPSGSDAIITRKAKG